MDAIATIKGLLDIAKQLKGFAKDAEGKMLVANLTSDLAELKIAFADLQEENHELRTKLKENEDLSALREHMERRDDVYFLEMDGRDPGPYCPKCLDVDGKLVPVSKFTGAFTAVGKYNSPIAKPPTVDRWTHGHERLRALRGRERAKRGAEPHARPSTATTDGDANAMVLSSKAFAG